MVLYFECNWVLQHKFLVGFCPLSSWDFFDGGEKKRYHVQYFREYGKPVKGFWGKGSGSKEWLISEVWSASYWFQWDNSHPPLRDTYVLPYIPGSLE